MAWKGDHIIDQFSLAEELFLYVFTLRGEIRGSGVTGEKTYGGKHVKLLLFPNQNPFSQPSLCTICNLTDYYIPSYTICQRVVPDYFKFLPLTEISFSVSLIL